ncbi:MAG: hypothetical protein EBS86_07590 [Crocinitomicaceae bacterium]|nr:hypothetical protein [Crocinitomicaceae bacterium]
MLHKIFKNPEAILFFSFIIGFGLAILIFRHPQKEVTMSALSIDEIRQKVVQVDGKCYRLRIQDASCPEPRLSV